MAEPESEWKALPIAAVAALYINGIQRFVRENLIAFFGAGTGFAVSESLGWREFGLAAGLVLLVGLLIAVVYHRRFRYRVDDRAVRVRKGFFEQQEVKVRFERVQNVGFSQPLYLRPLGLVRVSLETPGAAHTEVSLPGIALAEATAIRDRISAPGEPGPETGDTRERPDAGETGSQPAFVASAADLFRYGLTSNQIWILLALLGAPAGNWVDRRISAWVEQAGASGLVDPEKLANAPVMIALVVIGIVIAGALLLMVLSGILAIVRYYGYRLTVEDDRFKGRFGLLDAREKTLHISKLHSVALVQTTIGRVLGQWHAIGHQTGAQQPGQEMADERRFLVPGIDRSRLAEVAGMLTGTAWQLPEWRGIHPRFRSILSIRTSVALLIAAVMAWRGLPGNPAAPAIAILGVNLIALVAVHQRWRRWGIAFDARRLRVRSGLIGQRILEFEFARCQQIRVTTSPYQRRHGLASLNIRLPHGEQAIPYLPRELADRIANLALYRIESARWHGL